MERKQRQSVTSAILLESRMPRKDGHYPVKLRVTFQRKQKFYTIRYIPEKIGDDFTENQKYWLRKTDKSISMTENEFERIRKANPSEPFKTMSIYINTQEAEAQTTIARIKQFTFETFEEKYFNKPQNDHDVFEAIEAKDKALRKDERINTAVCYRNTLNSLKEFTKEEHCSFADINVKFLKEYEKWMLRRKIGKKQKNISKTTISIYLRCLRAVFNESAPEGTFYPFGKRRYMIPKWKHNKRALTHSEVSKIAEYPVVDGTMQHRSKDLWLFSFFCNGINFIDLANLRYSNIKGDTIVFERSKTAKSGDEVEDIIVIITRHIGRIIDRWGNKPAIQDQYIFDILKPGLTIENKHRAIRQAIKNTNKYMKRICTDLEIPVATTYVARHSFASVLKRSGASVEYISEAMGHKKITTTQGYLAGFEDEEKRKWAKKLADF